MEKNYKFNRLRRAGLAAALFFGILATSSCAEEQASTPVGESTAEDIFSAGNVTLIHPGESMFIDSVDSESTAGRAIIEDIAITEHQYAHGWDDDMSPIITASPTRHDAHVALSGKGSDRLDNDIACDTIRFNPGEFSIDEVSIGAIAISDGGDQAMVAWPEDSNGEPSDTFQLCFAEGSEPSDGVVLFVTDESR